jgi:hypothetical protein
MLTARFIDGSKRVVMLRGLEDGDVQRDPFTGEGRPSAPLRSLLLDLGLALQQQGASIRRYVRPAVGFPVASIAPDTTNPSMTRLQAANVVVVPPPGTYYRFNGVPKKDLPWLKGTWLPLKVDTAGLTLGYTVPSGLLVVPSRMWAYQVSYVYSALAPYVTGQPTFQFRDFRTRDTGRPIGVPRGRAVGIRFRR